MKYEIGITVVTAIVVDADDKEEAVELAKERIEDSLQEHDYVFNFDVERVDLFKS